MFSKKNSFNSIPEAYLTFAPTISYSGMELTAPDWAYIISTCIPLGISGQIPIDSSRNPPSSGPGSSVVALEVPFVTVSAVEFKSVVVGATVVFDWVVKLPLVVMEAVVVETSSGRRMLLMFSLKRSHIKCVIPPVCFYRKAKLGITFP